MKFQKISNSNFKDYSTPVFWIFIWTLIYTGLLWIVNQLLLQISTTYTFLLSPVYFYLISGVGLFIFSKLIESSIFRRSFQLNFISIYWILIFGFLLWLIDTIFNNYLNQFGYSDFMILIIKGLYFSLLIKFLRRVDFGYYHNNRNMNSFDFLFDNLKSIFIILDIVVILISFLYPIKYATREIGGSNLYCENSKVKAKFNFLGFGTIGASLTCGEYKSSKCELYCDDQTPMCKCKALIKDLLFAQKYGWIWDFGS